MTKRLPRNLCATAVAAAFAIGAVSSAHAALMLAATVGGASICATDDVVAGACPGGATRVPDALPLVPGTLSLGGGVAVAVGGLLVSGSLHTSTFGPPTNILSSSSLSVTNPTGAPLTALVAVGATDFTPPVTSATTSASGTWIDAIGSEIDLFWYNDPANSQGAETAGDRPGLLIDSFDFDVSLNPDAHAHVGGPFAVADAAPFSMTVAFDFTLTPGGSLTSRGQALIKPTAPEPGALLLLGTALGLLGWRYRKRAT